MFETIFLIVFGIVVVFYLYLFVGYFFGKVKRLRFWLHYAPFVIMALVFLLVIIIFLNGKLFSGDFDKPFF